jgi:UDP-N-acetylmuramoylalanine-D-glutamate ligase
LSPDGDLKEILSAASEKNIPVWGEVELFAYALRNLKETEQYSPKVIAITGTNGKTTVTSLTGLLCQSWLENPDRWEYQPFHAGCTFAMSDKSGFA